MGHCRECGFDLAGLPVGPGICPECGVKFVHPDAWKCAPLPEMTSLFLVSCLPSMIFAGTFVVLRHHLMGVLWVMMAAMALVMSYSAARIVSGEIADSCFPARARREREVLMRGVIVGANVTILLFGSAFVFA
jgi:hypothetical protein